MAAEASTQADLFVAARALACALRSSAGRAFGSDASSLGLAQAVYN